MLPGRVYLFMRTIVFVDGQNLYHRAKVAWSDTVSIEPNPYDWPSYDVGKLAAALVAQKPGRILSEIRFYTGVPNPAAGSRQARWQGFWANKFRYLRNGGIYVYSGKVNSGGQEKGVDDSLALEIGRAHV